MHSSFLDDKTTETLRRVVRKTLRREIRAIRPLRGGYNNRVVRLFLDAGEDVAAKISYPGGNGERDRCACEYGSLRFLWKNGIRTVPQPLGADRAAGIALYRFVEGTTPRVADIHDMDIYQTVSFIRQLDRLRSKAIHARLPVAAEASLRMRDYVDRIEIRLSRLEQIRAVRAVHAACRRYARDVVRPFFEEIRTWFLDGAENLSIDPDKPLPLRERFLNPSDFGFHNTLRRESGGLCFLDFEYFGWDDPAKMMADFLHQPAVPLTIRQKEIFLHLTLKHVFTETSLDRRVVLVYPMQGIKWSLILLNEFVGHSLARRRFADRARGRDENLGRQLRKSQMLLRNVAKDFYERKFPYPLPV